MYCFNFDVGNHSNEMIRQWKGHDDDTSYSILTMICPFLDFLNQIL